MIRIAISREREREKGETKCDRAMVSVDSCLSDVLFLCAVMMIVVVLYRYRKGFTMPSKLAECLSRHRRVPPR